jgi:hypothetical protein
MDRFDVPLGSVDLSLTLIKVQKSGDSAISPGCYFIVSLSVKRMTMLLSSLKRACHGLSALASSRAGVQSEPMFVLATCIVYLDSSRTSCNLVCSAGKVANQDIQRLAALKTVHFLGTPKPTKISTCARIYYFRKNRKKIFYSKGK